MLNRFTALVRQMSDKLLESTDPAAAYRVPTLADSLEAAREEWLNSQAYFETVTDPDLVDHAIFMMEAAKKRYTYLLKKAKETGLTGAFN
ncbi:MAG: YaaL family protein [Bacillota bacterium]|nr:YaaL family protein [Negativicutes bacterium]